ncbi:MAG: MBOAT family protein [Clostridia bacterium]|nr:MBOAT family protein [Clostridia bacterium]
MLFSSSLFLFLFLPIVLVGYYVLKFINRQLSNIWLLITSLIFYAWGEPKFVFVLMASAFINYIFGLLVDKFRDKKYASRIILSVMVFLNLGLLFVYKYLGFATENLNALFGDVLPIVKIALPIGISFFTFQAMSYVIDVYRGNGTVQKNPLNVALYIAFFPQLVAGPIVRYETVALEINSRKETIEDFCEGVKRFIQGLAKKVLLADILSVVADAAYKANAQGAGNLPVAFAWLGAICYSFQIFFDFSGYSDMAIGLGRMFGFHFLENFNFPYISKSVSEFWRRWHISLGTWFRDYLYIPLGGSRVKTKSRLVFNLLAVWALTGLWHGASWNFVIWGLMYFVLLAFEKLTGIPKCFKHKFSQILYRIFTLLCVVLGWVVFRAEGGTEAVNYLGSMFGLTGNALYSDYTGYLFRNNAVMLVLAVLFSVPLFARIKEICMKNKVMSGVVSVLTPIVYVALFVLSVSWLVTLSHHPFIYFNF